MCGSLPGRSRGFSTINSPGTWPRFSTHGIVKSGRGLLLLKVHSPGTQQRFLGCYLRDSHLVPSGDPCIVMVQSPCT